MSKIKLSLKIKSPDIEEDKKISGIINNNRIVYTDNGIKTTIVLAEPLYLSRENDDYKFEFYFDSNRITTGKYTLKMYNTSMPLKIRTLKQQYELHSLKLKYDLCMEEEECGIFEFNLKYEII